MSGKTVTLKPAPKLVRGQVLLTPTFFASLPGIKAAARALLGVGYVRLSATAPADARGSNREHASHSNRAASAVRSCPQHSPLV